MENIMGKNALLGWVVNFGNDAVLNYKPFGQKGSNNEQ
jgi:hypothetical protein